MSKRDGVAETGAQRRFSDSVSLCLPLSVITQRLSYSSAKEAVRTSPSPGHGNREASAIRATEVIQISKGTLCLYKPRQALQQLSYMTCHGINPGLLAFMTLPQETKVLSFLPNLVSHISLLSVAWLQVALSLLMSMLKYIKAACFSRRRFY